MRGKPKPSKYPRFLRWSGRADGSLTRMRYAEYRRRFMMRVYGPHREAVWTLGDRLRRALWAFGVWFRCLFGVSKIRLAGR